MDFQEARDRRERLPRSPGGDDPGLTNSRRRAADARMRRAVREAFARQVMTAEEVPERTAGSPRLHVVSERAAELNDDPQSNQAGARAIRSDRRRT
jgi:hypothetical protein